jgi:hypothetical protein
LGLKSSIDWRNYVKGEMPDKPILPVDIPNKPDHVYKMKGWKGWGDWLGTGFVAYQDREYQPFKQARAFVHTLKLQNKEDWKRYCKGEMPGKPPLPKDIFRNPQSGYEDKGWQGWGDWLLPPKIDSTCHSKRLGHSFAR